MARCTEKSIALLHSPQDTHKYWLMVSIKPQIAVMINPCAFQMELKSDLVKSPNQMKLKIRNSQCFLAVDDHQIAFA